MRAFDKAIIAMEEIFSTRWRKVQWKKQILVCGMWKFGIYWSIWVCTELSKANWDNLHN